MKKRVKVSFFKKDKFIEILKTIVVSLLTGMLGFAIGWIFDGRVVLSLVVFSVMAVFALVAWIFTIIYEKSVSILEILNDDIKHERYQEAVKLGYSVSRALFLSGKNQERYRISEKVCQALDKLEGNVIVNEKSESVGFLKSKLLIDDCGWSLYLLNRVGNRKAAESRIKEGINQCLRLSVAPQEAKKTYPVVFKGIRHLFGMSIENFDEISKFTLQNNKNLLSEYIGSIYNYGGILGYLLGDSRMADIDNKENYYSIFSDISANAKNANAYFDGLKKWCEERTDDKEFLLSTYNFRTKYFLGLLKASSLSDEASNDTKYLKYAKELSIKMTLGYAATQADYEWMTHTISFSSEIEKYDGDAFVKPDADRFVKGYVLVGTVAMISNDLQSLEDAKTSFIKAIAQSKKVNRVDTYLSAQRKLISVNERIFKLKYTMNYFDEYDQDDALEQLLNTMETILKESRSYLGYSDPKMEESCKERRKEYKKMIKSLRKKEKLYNQSQIKEN